jgi:hypothetical protein
MTVDDTFYYFKTAWNLAHGLGSSFDGLNVTNGYHPLWMALLLPIVKWLPFDAALISRCVLTVQIVLIYAAGRALARLHPAGAKLQWVALGFLLLNPFAAKIVLCGQETALQFWLSALLLAVNWKEREAGVEPSTRQWLGVSVLCALVTLARLDSLFFSILILTMPLLVPATCASPAVERRWRRVCTGMTVYTLCLAPYLLYNLLSTGHLMPVSGAIKATLPTDELAPLWLRATAAVGSSAALFGLWWLAKRAPRSFISLLYPALGAVLLLAFYNFAWRGELSPELIRIWYLAPHLLAGALFGGYVLARFISQRWFRMAAMAACVLAVCSAGLAWQYRLQPRSYALYAAAERSSLWLEQQMPEQAVAAAWDAGFAAAFTRKPVVNLDGLINSWHFKTDYLDSGRVDAYIDGQPPVDYVVQYLWPTSLKRIAARFRQGEWPSVAATGRTTSGSDDLAARQARWGADLAAFFVLRDDCITVSTAYDPRKITGAVHYLVLGRQRQAGTVSLAEFAVQHAEQASCD